MIYLFMGHIDCLTSPGTAVKRSNLLKPEVDRKPRRKHKNNLIKFNESN